MKLVRLLPYLLTVISMACGSSGRRDGGPSADASSGTDAILASDAAPAADALSDSGMIGMTDSGAPDVGVLDTGMADAGPPISIPDPGTMMDDWGGAVANVCCSTPDTAYPVGIVTMNSGYVQGNIDATLLEFFYVFRAGPALTQLTWIGETNLQFVDLHDGTGLVYGTVIPGTNIQPSRGTWNVTPNQIYVLHLHASSGGFF